MKTLRYTALLMMTLLLSALTLAAKGGGGSVEIKIQNGEKWWGLVVEPERIALPFDTPFVVNTSEFSPTLFRANMLLSNRGRYLCSKESLTVSFDGKKIVVTAPEGSTAPALQKSGRTLREAYLMCCHKNFPPSDVAVPELLFGSPVYVLGNKSELLVDQQGVEAFAEMLTQRGAPAGTILLPLGWSSPTGALTFDPEAFPSPKQMIASLHEKGMKVMLSVTPYLMAAGRGYRLFHSEQRLLTDEAGEPIVFRSRLGYTACLNLTPEVVEQMAASIASLGKEYGVDGFYFDCLDALPLLDDNLPKLTEFLDLWHSLGNSVEVAIYSTPVSRVLGNVASSVSTTRHYTWETLAQSLERSIDASLLGFERTSLAADLEFAQDGGELALRAAQLAALLPVAVIPYSVWSLEDTTPLCKMLSWRAKNSDYYLELARLGASSAEPIVRHLEYQFPRTGFTNCRDQFMIGNKWLVAPVVSESALRMVRLPKGRWREYESGRVFKGPRVIDVDVTSGKVALFERVE
ncbi:MAG: hypothetical protein J6V28_02920 [Tidjanibacter sp.]|nr:hypothetical protein [Tidjanibacter sp.]